MKIITKIEIKETDNELFVDIIENDYNIIKETIYNNDLSHQNDKTQKAYFDGIIATLEILNGYNSIDENFYI